MSKENHFKQSKRELWTILGTWVVFCGWVVGYCALFGYRRDPEELVTVLGMPSWVVWGIAVPWLFATSVTVYFGFFVMKDQPLEGGDSDGGEKA